MGERSGDSVNNKNWDDLLPMIVIVGLALLIGVVMFYGMDATFNFGNWLSFSGASGGFLATLVVLIRWHRGIQIRRDGLDNLPSTIAQLIAARFVSETEVGANDDETKIFLDNAYTDAYQSVDLLFDMQPKVWILRVQQDLKRHAVFAAQARFVSLKWTPTLLDAPGVT